MGSALVVYIAWLPHNESFWLFFARLTALHYAVQNNSVKSIQHLVSSFRHIATTHIPSADNLSLTPLMMAAKEGLTDALTVRLARISLKGSSTIVDICELQALIMNKGIVESIDQTDPEGKSGYT